MNSKLRHRLNGIVIIWIISILAPAKSRAAFYIHDAATKEAANIVERENKVSAAKEILFPRRGYRGHPRKMHHFRGHRAIGSFLSFTFGVLGTVCMGGTIVYFAVNAVIFAPLITFGFVFAMGAFGFGLKKEDGLGRTGFTLALIDLAAGTLLISIYDIMIGNYSALASGFSGI